MILTFNPMKITLTDEYVVVYNVYSTLVTWDKNYRSIGDLAYNWSLAPDDVTWTLHLVHGAHFVDPTNPADTSHPVTSSDVVFTYNLQMNQPASIFYAYVNQIQSISALDAYTVQIVTYQPFAPMSTTLATIPILPQYIWSGIGNPMNYNPSYPVGSGPVYYDHANSSSSLLIFRRSPSYYGPAYYCRQVRPDEIRFINYASSSTAVSDFLSGVNALDAVEGISPADYLGPLASWTPKWGVDEGFVGEFSINVMTPAIRAAYSQFHTGSNSLVLLNQTVRRAAAMSMNRTALIQDALLGLGHVADTLVPDSNPWHYSIPANQLYPFNTTAARATLNAAGWKYDASGTLNPGATPLYQKGTSNNTVYWPLIFRFYTLNTGVEWQVAAQDIVGWLAQAGIQTTDRLGNPSPGYGLYTLNQMNNFWFTGDYDLWLWDWVFSPGSDVSLDILSVETTMAIGPTSDNFYTNSTYDSLYNQSLTTIDPTARRNLTDTMQDMIYGYASYILPYYQLNLFAANDGARWTNWGDWSADPGLTPDGDLPDLWFQVEPVDNRAPAVHGFPAVQGENGTATNLAVNASDPDGDPLNFTWTFGDGSPSVSTTTPAVQHTYANVGNYTLGVVVSDGEWLACANATATIVPFSPTQNQPPNLSPIQVLMLFSFPNGTAFSVVGVPVGFQLLVQDPEGDPVNLTWYWGDGSLQTQVVTGTATQQLVPQTHVYAAGGNYTVVLQATDNQAGVGNHNVTENATGILVLVDTSPPVTIANLIGTPGQNGWYTSNVQVALIATDDLTGVAATAYAIDSGAAQLYTAPFPVTGDGTHTVQFASIDFAGNIETLKSIDVAIDTTGPTTTAALAGTTGSAGWFVTPVLVTLSASDLASGILATNYSVDGGTWQPYAAPFTVSEDGNHTVQFYSVNTAGLTETTRTQAIHIDGVAPTVSATPSGAQGSSGWFTSAATVTLAASDGMSGVASISYSLDGGEWTTYTGPISLSDGSHTLLYRATDVAGNTANVQSVTVKVDTTAPTLTDPVPNGRVTTSSVDVTWTGSDSGSGIVSYAVSVDGGAFQDVGLNDHLALSLSDGTHMITIRATDAAGNTVTQTTTVTVDTNVFSFTGPLGGLPTILLIVVVVAILVGLVWIRRRRKIAPAPKEEPPAPPNP